MQVLHESCESRPVRGAKLKHYRKDILGSFFIELVLAIKCNGTKIFLCHTIIFLKILLIKNPN